MSRFLTTRRAAVAGLLLSAMALPVPAHAEKTHVKLGFLGPLSGGNAQQGLGARNGFLLAIEQANAVADAPYEFEGVVVDDASDPQTGVSAAMKLVNDPQLAAATRKANLARLADEGWTILGYHLPEGGIGRVERQGKTFRFVASD